MTPPRMFRSSRLVGESSKNKIISTEYSENFPKRIHDEQASEKIYIYIYRTHDGPPQPVASTQLKEKKH